MTTIDEQLVKLCKILESDSVRLVYTSPAYYEPWKPWQVIAKYRDGSESYFKICQTAQEAISAAQQKVMVVNYEK